MQMVGSVYYDVCKQHSHGTKYDTKLTFKNALCNTSPNTYQGNTQTILPRLPMMFTARMLLSMLLALLCLVICSKWFMAQSNIQLSTLKHVKETPVRMFSSNSYGLTKRTKKS